MRVFGPPALLKYLVGFSVIVTLLLDGLIIFGFVSEGDSRGVRVAAGVLVPMTLLAFVVFARTWSRVELHSDRLVFGLWRSRQISLANIRNVTHRDAVVLHTAEGAVALRLGSRDVQAALVEALKGALPQCRPPSATLPFEWRPRPSVVITNVIMTILFGPGLLAIGVGLGIEAIGAGSGWSVLKDVALAVLFFAVGGLFLALFLFQFRWKIRFDETEIVFVMPARRRRFPAADLTALEVKSETRTYRGIERKAWTLELQFRTGERLAIEPTENGVAPEFSPGADRAELVELEATLRRLYGVADPSPRRDGIGA